MNIRSNRFFSVILTASLILKGALLVWGSNICHADTPFSRAWLEEHARDLAGKPYVSGVQLAPDFDQALTYEQNRDIVFNADHAIWSELARRFTVHLFHPGKYNPKLVKLHEVHAGTSNPIPFNPAWFKYGKKVPSRTGPYPVGPTGFRFVLPRQDPVQPGEIAVFQGASYFRAIAPGQHYGQSARGLAINTAGSEGEEFPNFEEFWLERPEQGAEQLVLHALLNSPSVTGAYSFTLRPQKDLMDMQVDAVLFFRSIPRLIGIAPFSSMFWYGPMAEPRPFDYRPQVHDSDGLLIDVKNGPRIWRVLEIRPHIRHTTFAAEELNGFGLQQRSRDFRDYLDVEAHYQDRPSVWVTPTGRWGAGRVHCIELPSADETNDNIVAFWEPAAPPPIGEAFRLSYRIQWLPNAPERPGLAVAQSSRRGYAFLSTDQLFVIEWRLPEDLARRLREIAAKDEERLKVGKKVDPSLPRLVPRVSVGPLLSTHGATVFENKALGTWRMTFLVTRNPETKNNLTDQDVRALLEYDGRVVSEEWTYLLSSPP